MLDFLFYLFAALALLASLFVVLNPNPVNSAMFMIVAFVGTAALFLLLDAFFLAILQVLVYAGAVMVLFLFIIMLIEVEQQTRLKMDRLTVVASVLALLLLGLGCVYLFAGPGGLPELARMELPADGNPPAQMADDPLAVGTAARLYGYGLFTKYMLPFQVTGFLLLIAMVGVIVLSKRYRAPTASGRQQPS